MKKILTLTLGLFLSIANANIIDAQNYFDQENYTQSFKEYQKLAKLGNVRAQYNVGTMLFKGQGVEKNTLDAYAWLMAAETIDPEVEQFLKLVEKDLNPEDLATAKTDGLTLIKLYGYKQSETLLGPVEKEAISQQEAQKTFIWFKTRKSSMKKIDYPQRALKKSGRGWVDLSYNIYPDGSVRDINITNQYPHVLFAPSAIDFISKQNYDAYQGNSKITLEHEFYTSYRIKYGIYGIGFINSQMKRKIAALLKSALAGSLEAQYQYTNLYYTILNNGGGVSEKTINKWLFRSAQFGLVDAQFRLGENIYHGQSCKQEKQKGLDWIIRAAQNNNIEAQYLAYHLLRNNDLHNISEKTAQYWLDKSAENGSLIGQIKYAKYISWKENSTFKDIDLAFKYLDNYAEHIAQTADWYQTRALLFSKINKHSEATKAITKAIKLAKKAHWDLTELLEQKNNIKQHK